MTDLIVAELRKDSIGVNEVHCAGGVGDHPGWESEKGIPAWHSGTMGTGSMDLGLQEERLGQGAWSLNISELEDL